MAFYSNIEDVKEVFLKKDVPDWELYNGKPRNRPGESTRYKYLLSESSSDDLHSSWLELEEALNRVSAKGGNGTLFLGPKDQTPVLLLPIRFSVQTMTRQTGNNSAGVTGIRSMNETLEDKMKIYDLQRRLEDVENASGGIWDSIGQSVAEKIDPNTIVNAVTMLITSMAGKANVNGTQDVSQPIENVNNEIAGELPAVSDSVNEIVSVLNNELGDEKESAKFLSRMAEMIKQNPAIIKNLG